MRLKGTGCAALVAALSMGYVGAGAQVPSRLKRLQNLPPVHVVISEPPPGNDAADYQTYSIRTAIELKLRQNRIRVLTEEDTKTFPDALFEVFIVVDWNSNRTQRLYAFRITLKQYLWLRPGVPVQAELWTYGMFLGSVGTALSFRDDLQARISGGVDAFLNDYLTANPPH
jgi:hypothetical protein